MEAKLSVCRNFLLYCTGAEIFYYTALEQKFSTIPALHWCVQRRKKLLVCSDDVFEKWDNRGESPENCYA